MRHLHPSFAVVGALQRGAEIEQLLDRTTTADGVVLRWMSGQAAADGYRLLLHTVLDLHEQMGTFGVYEYPSADNAGVIADELMDLVASERMT